MYLHPGIGRLLLQKGHAPCLVARQVMIDHAPGGKDKGKLFVWLLGGRNIGDGMETRLPIGEAETLLVKAWCAGMIFARAGPEDTILLINLLVGNAPVIGLRALCAEPEFVKDLA